MGNPACVLLFFVGVFFVFLGGLGIFLSLFGKFQGTKKTKTKMVAEAICMYALVY